MRRSRKPNVNQPRRQPAKALKAPKAPKARPAVEALESRDVPAGLFLQGQSYIDANANGQFDVTDPYMSNATVELRTADGSGLLATTTTDASGWFRFNDANVPGGLNAGTYRVVELPAAGFANNAANADLWKLGPASVVNAKTLQVTLSDLTSPPPPPLVPLQLVNTGFTNTQDLRLTLTNPLPTAVVPGIDASGRFIEEAGEVNITLSGGGFANPTSFITYCLDLTDLITTSPSAVIPQSAPVAPTLTVNAGRMAYLYNHYGINGFSSSIPGVVNGITTNPSEAAAAFQVAMWELCYDTGPGNIAADGTGGNFFFRAVAGQPDGSTDPVSSRIRAAANAFLQDSIGKVEQAIYLDGPTTKNQLTIIGGSLNFGNIPAPPPPATPAINTVAGGTIIIGSGAKLTDTAVLSGGNNPTGTITFELFSPSNVVVYTDVVTVTGNGTYTTATGTNPGGYLPTATGNYLWRATYSGDSKNAGAVDNGQNENEAVSPTSPAINTVAGGTVVIGSGAKLSDTAVLSGGYNPTGTITFTLYSPSNVAVYTDVVAVSGNGTYTTAVGTNPGGFTPTDVGTYLWSATYSGDANNAAAADNGVNESETVTPAGPAINTVAGGTVVIGSGAKLTDTAVLSGGFSPTGAITFQLYSPSGGLVDTETVTVAGNGTYFTPTGYAPTEVGTYLWKATYSGDKHNAPAADNGQNENETVLKAGPAITTKASATAGGVVGTSILSDSAVVSGSFNGTGSVTFSLTAPDGTTSTVGVVAVTGNGVYNSPTVLATQVGTYTWHATYSGDKLNNGAVDDGTNESVTTVRTSPTVFTKASSGGTVGAVTLKDSAVVTGSYKGTGTITFTLTDASNKTVDTETVSVTGDGTYTTPGGFTPTQVGTYTWSAKYSGDGLNNGAIDQGGAAEQTAVTPAGPSINTVAGGTIVIGSGQKLTDTAVLSGGFNPTGTITFKLFSPSNVVVYTDVVTVSGNGTYTTATGTNPGGYLPTATGTYLWQATYSGDSRNAGAVDNGQNENETVTKAGPQINTTPNGTSTPGGTSISGVKLLDLTGNGFSVDDTPKGSVPIKLYKETNGVAGLQVGTGGDTLAGTATTAADGTYTFPLSVAGTYYVQESVPTGYLQTGGGPNGTAGNTYYTVNATLGNRYSGYNFDDFALDQCDVTSVSYQVLDNGYWTTVSDLAGNTNAGDTVRVTFTVPAGTTDTVTLVSYAAASPSWSDSNAYKQLIYQQATGTFGPGVHTLTVQIPKSYYQIDFVCGSAIDQLEPNQNGNAYGPDSANILYHAQQRFFSSDSGGTTMPATLNTKTPMTPAPTTTASSGSQTLNDSATLSGGSNPGGTITFYLMGPGSTASTPLSQAVYTDVVSVSGNGTYTTSQGNQPGGYVATAAGTYQWVAVYSGDGNNSTVTSPFGSEPWTVAAPGIDIEKTTNGPSNSNPTAPDYDNEDAPNGPGVPALTPGSSVTWTYKVTNTGGVAFASSAVVVTDDNGTPGNTADDMSTANGKIVFDHVQTGDNDGILEPGEVWIYKATGTVQNLGAPAGQAVTLDMSGSSALNGTAGNIRTFTDTTSGVSVKASAFSRDKSSGAWSTAYLGAYGGGLGVTDTSEDGSNNTHTVDNIGRDNYVLFEFNQSVVVDSAFLGYVVGDSDLTIWIGTIPNAFNSHQTLSDALLTSLGFTEVNLTDLTSARTADFNAGKLAGNVLVIAAWTGDTTPDDRFKIQNLTVNKASQGEYENKAVVTVTGFPGLTDSDLSHYTNSTPLPPPPVGSISGYKFLDKDADGKWESGEPVLKNWTIYVDLDNDGVKDPGEPTDVTDANGYYEFDNLPAGTYTVREVQQSGWNQSLAPASFTLAAGQDATNKNFGNYQNGSITGYKFLDRNGDGVWDKNGQDNCSGTGDDETPLANWVIYLDLDNDGVKDAGEPTDVTDANGYYSFTGLKPGTYHVREVQQAGYVLTTDLDSLDVTVTSGQNVCNVNLGNFKGSMVMSGDTATIGFWNNNNGQRLIRSLNGGGTNGTATKLGNWLASNFGNLFGNLAGKNNDYVASYFQFLFSQSGPKLGAQIMATALAVYVTDSDLAGGNYAATYGFTVTTSGVANDSFNIGDNGAAFNVANGTAMTVWDILKTANSRIWTWAGNQTYISMANDVFSGINQTGDITS